MAAPMFRGCCKNLGPIQRSRFSWCPCGKRPNALHASYLLVANFGVEVEMVGCFHLELIIMPVCTVVPCANESCYLFHIWETCVWAHCLVISMLIMVDFCSNVMYRHSGGGFPYRISKHGTTRLINLHCHYLFYHTNEIDNIHLNPLCQIS